MAGWANSYWLLHEEFIQRADEGCRIPEELTAKFGALDPETEGWQQEGVDTLYDALMAVPADAELAEAEPNELDAIRALRPDGPRDLHWQPSADELLDRLHGAWTGRCVGCALGKPVEGCGMGRDADGTLNGRRRIREYLQARNEWPLRDYFSCRDIGDGDILSPTPSTREHIVCMEPDDDIHYSLVGLGVLEEHGVAFTWQHVAAYWLAHIPMTAICTAETQAILNVQNVSLRGRQPQRDAAWIRRYRNPYREWIGAQIRADGWAYACAGNPERAAELAWRDAHWTHERNGIYGEMMMAAMIAASFVEHDAGRLVEIGLSEIPRDCRLARWVRRCIQWIADSADWESCMEKLEAELGDMHPVHTINNALICIIAMHYGRMDTTETPAIAVMCGLDTDCNGATVGSMVGAATGRRAFGGIMANRLNDTIRPEMLGFQQVTMRELAERSARCRTACLTR